MQLIKELLKGVLIGIANIIPGVSGGTMAVSMGIYDTLISCITNLFKDMKHSIKTLLPYFIGMGLGIVGLSFVIEFLFRQFPLPTGLLFIGLILGGLPSITSRLKGTKIGIPHILLFATFFALIILLQISGGENTTSLESSFSAIQMIQLFLIGVIASATMIIPGVSGSLILMLLGYYTPIIEQVSSFVRALIAFDVPAILGGINILLPFGIGVLVGIFAIAKLIEYLLKKAEGLTYSAILGLVIASPFAVIMGLDAFRLTFGTILLSILTFAIGYLISNRLGQE